MNKLFVGLCEKLSEIKKQLLSSTFALRRGL